MFNLYNENLTKVPDIVRAYKKSITHLNLNKNSLTELPKWIEELEKLEGLFLADNLFEQFPRNISELKSLKNIWITDNPLNWRSG